MSSHNSSKLSSSNSGSNVTKTTVDLSHHELNSTQISPISARERELGARRPLVDTSHNNSHVTNSTHINGGLNLSRNTETLSRTENRERTKAGPGNGNVSNLMLLTTESGVKEMIQSLGLLCLVSLLLALGIYQLFHFCTPFYLYLLLARISCIFAENPPLSPGGRSGQGSVPVHDAGGGHGVSRHGGHVRPHPLPEPLVPPGVRHTVSVCS